MYKTQKVKIYMYQYFKRQLKTPTCFGSFGIHLQGVLKCASLKLLVMFRVSSRCLAAWYLDCNVKRNVKFVQYISCYTILYKFDRGFQKVYAPRFPWHSAHEGGEVVSLTHWPPSPPGMFLVLIFTRGWVDPRVMVQSEGICHWKIQWHHRQSIPDRPTSSAAP